MVTFEGVRARVVTGDEIVPEYPDPIGTKKRSINRYVEGRAGTSFKVSVECAPQILKKGEGIICTLVIDERAVDRVLLRKGHGQSRAMFDTYRGMIQEFKDVGCEYRFADPGDKTRMEAENEYLGTISLIVQRVCNIPKLKQGHPVHDGKRLRSEKNVLPEDREKKGIERVATLGPPKPAEVTKYYQRNFDWIDEQDEPFITVNFKYRAREALQKLHIIPPPPPPPRLEDRPLESLSREELIGLCRMYKERSLCKCTAESKPPNSPQTAKRKREDGLGMPDPAEVMRRKRRHISRFRSLRNTPRMMLKELTVQRHTDAGTLG